MTSHTESTPQSPVRVFIPGFVQIGEPEDVKKAEMLLRLWQSDDLAPDHEGSPYQRHDSAHGQ